MAEAAHTYKFDVAMSCNGCSGAVERVLKKLEGEFDRLSGSYPSC
jgi:copper chaperone CopZ